MIISINKMGSVLQCFLLSVLFLGFTNIFSTVAANSISVNYDADSTRYKSIIFKTPLEIQCNTNESDIRMEWYKNGVNITALKDNRINIQNNRLVILDPQDEDVGNYTCKAVSTKINETIGKRDIEVIVKLHVGMQKDVTVVEGEKLKLECVVLGKPSPEVSWTFGNETYYRSRDRVVLQEHNGVPNALFVIKEAKMEDRGLYSCTATLANNSTAVATAYVRVKDKLAALWPFLGICAEVFVLCGIILIYEKKRNKTELEESDTDNSPETKNTPDHGKDSVRQRK
ncbi:neuroplastin isoform X1 [Cryptotermes secundus]|uniref:neuroplastin isoform X1 n=2 Tax=Cryptotermes secundus TaxID=105785 RepID=UPI000CD7C96A|nr:neuroplastin isoform X1 [Cryptotermes secundus]